jgi:cytoskeleton protein RodZ
MTNTNRYAPDSGSGLEYGAPPFAGRSDNLGVPLDTIGQDLRKTREGYGLTLEAVSHALKIRVDHLAALEESNSEGLPGRPYAIGFIRSYASYLGLDPVRSVERFKAEIAGRQATLQTEIAYPVAERRLPKSVVLVLLLLLVTAVAYGGYSLLVSANRAAEPPVATLPERLAVNPPESVPSPIVPPAATAESPAEPAVAAPLPEGRAYGTGNANSRVTLRAHQATKLLVQGADNTVFINRTLAPGDLYQTPNLVGLKVSTPDAGAFEVILDGMSLGFLGGRGVIANGLSLNPQDLVDRSGRGGRG